MAHTKAYKRLVQNRKDKDTLKPGDLISEFERKAKKYKLKVSNKLKAYGTTDNEKKTIVINKKLAKTKPTHKRNVDGRKGKYPELGDSILHEIDHAIHDKKREKTVWSDTRKAMKKIGKKSKQKLYSLFDKKKGK